MYYFHNIFITILAELGFVLFVLICFKIIKNIFYLGLSLINLLLMSFFLHNINDKFFWGMFIPISMTINYWVSNKEDLIVRKVKL